MSANPARRAVLALVLGSGLSGCGFRPVYMKTSEGARAADGLARIEVGPMFERPGQLMRQALIARLDSDSGTEHKFDLAVNFWIEGQAIAVLTYTQPTRIRLVGHATWTLTGRDPAHTKLAEGSERAVDGLDIIDSQYFAIDLDNEHVQRRLANQMADSIATRLAMWFKTHPTAVG